MPKIPKSISGRELVQLLKKFGYSMVRQTGSHIRLISAKKGHEHKITVPNHKSIKIGTLNHILNDLSDYLEIPKDQLIEQIFKK
jgi:predicted RNA binding protein YcfA (HicA-like mRNA interferase family)